MQELTTIDIGGNFHYDTWSLARSTGSADEIESSSFYLDTKMLRAAVMENNMVPTPHPVAGMYNQKPQNDHLSPSSGGGFLRAYSPRIHAVIQEARKVFERDLGMTPEHLDLTPLRERLSAIRADDVNGARLNALARGEVGYVSLEDNPHFTIGVFFLAPGARIPLHDHPEMCVLSQLVKGTVHVTSFDFDLSSANNLAFLVDDGMYTAPVTRTLYPTSGGNLHSFATKTGCIIVDVMSPPYDELDGRECTYFKALSIDNQMYRVESTQPPDDFEVLDLS
jgi:hypothetical protein